MLEPHKRVELLLLSPLAMEYGVLSSLKPFRGPKFVGGPPLKQFKIFEDHMKAINTCAEALSRLLGGIMVKQY